MGIQAEVFYKGFDSKREMIGVRVGAKKAAAPVVRQRESSSRELPRDRVGEG